MLVKYFPTLNDCMDMIHTLIKEKHHERSLDDNTLFKKTLFAILELSEAIELVKKKGIDNLDDMEVAHLGEEWIDAIFYILDSYGLVYRSGKLAISPDNMFEYKFKKNMERDRFYGRPKEKRNKD